MSKTFLTSATILGAALIPDSSTAKETKTVELPTVTVIENGDENYNSTESSYYKFGGRLVDTPRTVTTVTRKLMDDQGTTKVSDALRNVPGISLAAGEGGSQGDNLTIRGFSARGDFFLDGMRDFGSYFRDPFNMESIEVVQGPSSVLFGRGSTGGVIQQNSKQAFLGSKKEADLMLGTNETTRATVDVNNKIGEHSAIRLNAMGHRNKVAGRDEALFRRAGFAPTLAFGLGTDTRFTLSHLYQKEDNIPDYGIPFYAGKPLTTDRSNFYGYKSDYLKTEANITTAKFEHDFSDSLTFRNQARYAHYLRDVFVVEPKLTTDSSTVTRNVISRRSVETYLGDQADFISKFSALGVDHNAVTGFAVSTESSTPTTLRYNGVPTTDSQYPGNSDVFSYTSLVTTGSTASNNAKGRVDTLGVYLMDNVKFNKQWELSLGGRFDKINSYYDQKTVTGAQTSLSRVDNVLSYSLGLVYKPHKNGSIYFNTGTSFNPSAENISLSTTTFNLKPEKNRLYEIGTKWDVFKKRLTANFSVFKAEKENAMETTASGDRILSGKQQVYGFLAQISGKITDKWNIMTGYSYMDGRVVKSAIDPTYINRALVNVPEHSFSLFTTYQLTDKLQVGGGANYVGKRAASTTTTDVVNGQVRTAPGYLTFNAMAKYPLDKNIDLQLNVNNLTNAYYFDQIRGNNAVIPGEGRVVLLSTKIKF